MIERQDREGRRQYVNVSRVMSRGLESGFTLRLPLLRASGDVDYVFSDSRDRGTGKPMPHVPMHRTRTRIACAPLPGIHISVRGDWAGPRSGESTYSTYDGYAVMHGTLAGTWRMFSASMFIDNIFDTEYATEDPAYPMPGRVIRAQLSLALNGSIKHTRPKGESHAQPENIGFSHPLHPRLPGAGLRFNGRHQ